MNPLMLVPLVGVTILSVIKTVVEEKHKPGVHTPPAPVRVEEPPVQEPTHMAVVIDFTTARERILDRRY